MTGTNPDERLTLSEPRYYPSAVNAVRGAVIVLLALVLSAALPALPSFAADETATGDVTPPRLLSLTLDPAAVDVSDGPAQSVVTIRIADEDTGVRFATLEYHRPTSRAILLHAAFTRVSGDEFDGVWRAVMDISQHAEPGDWPLTVHATDRVGNNAMIGPEVLRLAGHPAALAVTSRTPDTTAPEAVTSAVSPERLDVTAGAATAILRVGVRDALAGTSSVSLYAFAPDGSSGGGTTTPARLVEGTPQDGVWEGSLQVPQYARAGRWELAVRLTDSASNSTDVQPEQLQSVGTAIVTVESQEDTRPPEVLHGSPLPSELDVSDTDQQLDVRLTVTDDLSGVRVVDHDTWAVGLLLQHPLGQQAGVSGMQLVEGTARDGEHAATFVVPRSSATGPWRVVVHVTDEIGNHATLDPLALERLGLPQAVLVYNTPLPPEVVEVLPGDGAATVTWEPPSDERGAEVVEYLVDDLTSGRTLRAAADDRSLVVPALRNGMQHDFAVRAVNKAGASDPSGTVSATPSGTSPLPEEPAEPSAAVARLSGSDRLGTAIAISRDAWADQQAQSVVLARWDAFPDALAGTPLAVAKNGPVLLTPSTGLNNSIANEIKRVLPAGRTVYLLGGPTALSAGVADAVARLGYKVSRLGGADRYATAVTISKQLGTPARIFEATGLSFQNALISGVAAAGTGGVVILTADGKMPAITKTYLDSFPHAERIAVGAQAATADPSATKIAGASVYDTARLLAQRYFPFPKTAALASGTVFADALAGGAHIGRVGGPLLLSEPTRLPAEIAGYLSTNKDHLGAVTLYGGPAALSAAVEDTVRSNLRQ